jgi:hypothetical protein
LQKGLLIPNWNQKYFTIWKEHFFHFSMDFSD